MKENRSLTLSRTVVIHGEGHFLSFMCAEGQNAHRRWDTAPYKSRSDLHSLKGKLGKYLILGPSLSEYLLSSHHDMRSLCHVLSTSSQNQSNSLKKYSIVLDGRLTIISSLSNPKLTNSVQFLLCCLLFIQKPYVTSLCVCAGCMHVCASCTCLVPKEISKGC